MLFLDRLPYPLQDELLEFTTETSNQRWIFNEALSKTLTPIQASTQLLAAWSLFERVQTQKVYATSPWELQRQTAEAFRHTKGGQYNLDSVNATTPRPSETWTIDLISLAKGLSVLNASKTTLLQTFPIATWLVAPPLFWDAHLPSSEWSRFQLLPFEMLPSGRNRNLLAHYCPRASGLLDWVLQPEEWSASSLAVRLAQLEQPSASMMLPLPPHLAMDNPAA